MVSGFEIDALGTGALHPQPWGNVDDGKIHKADTVPPPPGESDAYNAPTRVGAITSDAWADLIEAAQRRDMEEAATPKAAGLLGTPPAPPPATNVPARSVEAPPTIEELPRLSTDDDELGWIDDEEPPSEKIAREIAAAIALSGAPNAQPASEQKAPVTIERPATPSILQPVPAPRASLFPEWVAGTNMNEVEAREAARRQKIRTTVRYGIGIAVVLAVGTWAIFR